LRATPARRGQQHNSYVEHRDRGPGQRVNDEDRGHDCGGLLREYDWDAKVVWEYRRVGQHHDFRPGGSTAGYVKLLLPPRQSRGNSYFGLAYRAG
jgi:hypothetical protein